MSWYIDIDELCQWLESVSKEDLIYHKARQAAWVEFSDCLNFEKKNQNQFEVSDTEFDTIELYLTSRSEQISSDSRLNFRKTISKMIKDARKFKLRRKKLISRDREPLRKLEDQSEQEIEELEQKEEEIALTFTGKGKEQTSLPDSTSQGFPL